MVLSARGPRRMAALSLVGVLFFSPAFCLAQLSELDAIRGLVKNLEQQLQKALVRIDQLEKEKAADSARVGQVEKSVQAVQSAPSILNPAIGMAIDATAEQRSKAGGNFNFRAAELGDLSIH